MCQFVGSVNWSMGMSGLEICLPLPVPYWKSLFSISYKPVNPGNQCDKNKIASAQLHVKMWFASVEWPMISCRLETLSSYSVPH